MDLEYIKKEADIIFDDMKKARRDIHKNPEIGDNEYETQKYIIEFLEENNIKYKKIARTGVLAIINGKKEARNNEGKVVALRADIDALEIDEKNENDYKSQNKGIMHACGHDAHTAINLGVAKFFARNCDKFNGSIKLFFQPAEETIGGAKRMVEEGALKSPDVDYVIGLHLMPNFRYNQVEIKYGTLNVSTDSLELKVIGKAAHAAYPDKGVDAILISAYILTAIQSIISRTVSPLENAVISFGKIRGGTAPNVIADEVVLNATIRTPNKELRKVVFEKIENIASAMAESMGGKAILSYGTDGYTPLVNDSFVVDVIEEAANEYLGSNNVFLKDLPSMGGEDFSFFIDEAQGAFYHLGCKVDDSDEYFLHTDVFDIDERALKTGLVLEAYIASKLLNKE